MLETEPLPTAPSALAVIEYVNIFNQTIYEGHGPTVISQHQGAKIKCMNLSITKLPSRHWQIK